MVLMYPVEAPSPRRDKRAEERCLPDSTQRLSYITPTERQVGSVDTQEFASIELLLRGQAIYFLVAQLWVQTTRTAIILNHPSENQPLMPADTTTTF